MDLIEYNMQLGPDHLTTLHVRQGGAVALCSRIRRSNSVDILASTIQLGCSHEERDGSSYCHILTVSLTVIKTHSQNHSYDQSEDKLEYLEQLDDRRSHEERDGSSSCHILTVYLTVIKTHSQNHSYDQSEDKLEYLEQLDDRCSHEEGDGSSNGGQHAGDPVVYRSLRDLHYRERTEVHLKRASLLASRLDLIDYLL